MTITVALEPLPVAWEELDPLFRAHYAEVAKRMEAAGLTASPYAPRRDAYERANVDGRYLMFVVREDEKIVGYSGVWLTQDMHNGDDIAREDTVYVVPEHRRFGIGPALTRHILADLRDRGVKRAFISPVKHPNGPGIWLDLGFTPYADLMVMAL